jgi:hypothetical protein
LMRVKHEEDNKNEIIIREMKIILILKELVIY